MTARSRRGEKGSLLVYSLLGIVLIGLLAAVLTRGADRSFTAAKLDEMMLYLEQDLKTVHAAAAECAQSYPGKVDINSDGNDDYGNPNVPFPLYDDLSSGGAGAGLADIRCPGAPAQAKVFGADMGNRLRLLNKTAVYTTTYFSVDKEGVYLRVVPVSATVDPIWIEAITRLDAAFPTCAVYTDTSGTGTLYYWILRRPPGGDVPLEGGCPYS